MLANTLSDQEFSQFRSFIYRIAGINLSSAKKPMVVGRLARRVDQHRLSSFAEYFRLLNNGSHPDEVQMAVDLLTTNETYFFREHKHFDFLRENILPQHPPGKSFRVWSAASSSGQEAYSIAMVLDDRLKSPHWEITASDISARVLETARRAHYPLEQAEHIPPRFLSSYCLKGVGSQQGTFLIARNLRERVNFMQVNLNTSLPRLGTFDVIFLRNVMIYFDAETKRQVTRRIAGQLKPGGHLLLGHSESLNGIDSTLQTVVPSVYRKPL